MKLEEIYDSVGDRIYHYLTIKLGSQNDAEDVLQEVFFRLTRYSLRLHLVRNIQAFVFRVARNEAHRFLRKKLKMGLLNSRQSPELYEVIKNALSGPNPEEKETVSRALAQLPGEQREVIVLKFFEELTFKEISQVCEISIHTAASRCRYGLKKMRSILGGSRER